MSFLFEFKTMDIINNNFHGKRSAQVSELLDLIQIWIIGVEKKFKWFGFWKEFPSLTPMNNHRF